MSGLKIAVLAKAALDVNLMEADASGNVNTETMPLVISSYDKNAMEEALRIKEKFGGEIHVLSALTWGPLKRREGEAENVIREVIAMGADEAHLIVDEGLMDGEPSLTATALAKLAEKLGGFDLYLAGEASMDMLSSQLPAKLAEFLNIPIITFVREVELKDGKLRAVRSLEDVFQVVECPLPAVLSVTGEINQPRYTTMLQIRKAFRKPINKYSLSDLGISVERRVTRRALKVLPVERKAVKIEGENLDEVAEKLIEVLVKEGIIKG